MDFKALAKTKIFWLGLLAIGGGVIEAVFDGWSSGVDKIMVGAAMIFGRGAAMGEAKKVAETVPTQTVSGEHLKS